MEATEYKTLVEAARKIYLDLECKQSEIAKLALKACNIVRGGSQESIHARFTLKDFASDSGIPYGALRSWVGTYQMVLQKIDIKNPTKEQWAAGYKTFNSLRTLEDRPTAQGRNFKEAIPKERIRNHFDRVAKEAKTVNAAHTSLKYAQMVKSTLKKVDLKEQNTSILTQIMDVLDEVSDLINDHLTSQKRKGA